MSRRAASRDAERMSVPECGAGIPGVLPVWPVLAAHWAPKGIS